MAYSCELAIGQTLFLNNPGGQTVITTASGQSGQQQQSSQSLTTGPWTALPAIFALGTGAAIRLTTAQGEFWVQIQGGQLSGLSPDSFHPGPPLPLQAAPPSPSPSLPSMQPMQPMSLGNLQSNPMEMRMGNMEMRMPPMAPLTPLSPLPSPPSPQAPAATPTTTPATPPKFCSQCGAALRPVDRFCSSCGQPIG